MVPVLPMTHAHVQRVMKAGFVIPLVGGTYLARIYINKEAIDHKTFFQLKCI